MLHNVHQLIVNFVCCVVLDSCLSEPFTENNCLLHLENDADSSDESQDGKVAGCKTKAMS